MGIITIVLASAVILSGEECSLQHVLINTFILHYS